VCAKRPGRRNGGRTDDARSSRPAQVALATNPGSFLVLIELENLFWLPLPSSTIDNPQCFNCQPKILPRVERPNRMFSPLLQSAFWNSKLTLNIGFLAVSAPLKFFFASSRSFSFCPYRFLRFSSISLCGLSTLAYCYPGAPSDLLRRGQPEERFILFHFFHPPSRMRTPRALQQGGTASPRLCNLPT
jgi:hypothetical protein